MDRVQLKGKCGSCDMWRPHVMYGYIGYCKLHSKITFEDDSCSSYRPLQLDSEYYWCLTCRMRLTREEAPLHISRGHRVYKSAYVDPDIREEIYDAF